jgi:nicotinate-nucleotide adenylyltransferase
LSRIGLLGGTFSPPTNAHLSIASFAKSQFQLDQVLVIPCSVPTLGKAEKPIEPHHRFNMCVLATFGVGWMKVVDWELQKEMVYSYETLEHLHKEQPAENFFFIGGSDSISQIDKWREPVKLASMTDFIVVPRNDTLEQAKRALQSVGKPDDGILILDYPRNDLSSTIIRQRLRFDQPCDFLMPKAVRDYIKTNNLFKEDKTGTH